MALAGLEAAITADPDIDFIFTSSDFLFPTIQGVLEPRGKWKKTGEEGHVILGGLDGDDGACKLIREGYVDSTGVQDVYLEAKLALDSIMEAIEKGDPRPNAVKLDPGLRALAGELRRKGRDDLGLHGPRREAVVLASAGREDGSSSAALVRGRRDLPAGAEVPGNDGAARADEARLAQSRRKGATERGLRSAGLRSRARLLVSEYFILYLTFAYFVAMAVVLPRPRHAAQHQQPALQRLAAACRRDRPDLRHHHHAEST